MIQGCGREIRHCGEIVEVTTARSQREHDGECCCDTACRRQILGKITLRNFTGIVFSIFGF